MTELSIKDQIEHRETGVVYPDSWVDVVVTADSQCSPTGETSGFSVLNEYTTTLRLSTFTRCNPVQWESEQEYAERRLFQTLYAPQLEQVPGIITAIRGRDANEAIKLVLRLRDTMIL